MKLQTSLINDWRISSVYAACNNLKNSLIIHEDKTKEIHVQWVSLYVIKTRLPFSINFFLDFTVHTSSIYKMADLKFSQGKAGWVKTIKRLISKVLVPLKYFKVLVGLRSQFKCSTSDFTGITKPSCIKKARLFKKYSEGPAVQRIYQEIVLQRKW